LSDLHPLEHRSTWWYADNDKEARGLRLGENLMTAFTESQIQRIREIVDGFQALPADVWKASMQVLRDEQEKDATKRAADLAALLATHPALRVLLGRLLEEIHSTCKIREWALQQFTEEEIVAGLKEARAHRGPELGQLIQEIEQELHGRERTSS
jgi:hypothetical protein